MKKKKVYYTFPGSIFGYPSERARDAAQRARNERVEREKLAPPEPAPAHGEGDPSSPYPGDRPEAYSTTLTPEKFASRFTGDISDFKAIYSAKGQIYGHLLRGKKPADGFMVDAKGFVVPVPKEGAA